MLIFVHLVSQLLEIGCLSRQRICVSLDLVVQTRDLLVFVEVLSQELIDPAIQLIPLLLEMLHLLLEGGMLRGLHGGEAILHLTELTLQVLNSLLLEIELVLNLGGVVLRLLLEVLQLVLQVIDLDLLLSGGLGDLEILLVLNRSNLAGGALLLLCDASL